MRGFISSLHWWVLGGLLGMLALLFAISLEQPRSIEKPFAVNEDEFSTSQKRQPASHDDLEKSLQMVITDPLLLKDLKKVTNFARCAMNTDCRLQNGPWALYQAMKGHRTSFDNRQYKKIVDDLVEFVLTGAEQKRIDPQSPFFQEIKKVLNDYYNDGREAQQDCWSCTGSSEFHRYYLLTGEQPASLRIQGEDDFDGSPELAPSENER